MASKHTPGPWEIELTPNGKEETGIISAHGGTYHVADCFTSLYHNRLSEGKDVGAQLKASQANLLLVAAAPKMLHALEEADVAIAVSLMSDLSTQARNACGVAWKLVNEAKAEAKGRSDNFVEANSPEVLAKLAAQAAGPELLEALKGTLALAEAYYRTLPDDGAAQDHYMSSVIGPARAAIAKATPTPATKSQRSAPLLPADQGAKKNTK